MAKQDPGRLARAIIGTADGMRRTGITDAATHERITLRHLAEPTGAAEPVSGEEIRQVRERAHPSQRRASSYRSPLPQASPLRATAPISTHAMSGRTW